MPGELLRSRRRSVAFRCGEPMSSVCYISHPLVRVLVPMRSLRRRWRLLLCFAMTLLVVTAAHASSADSDEVPAATVTRLHEVLIDTMRSADELGFSGRHDRLAPVLARSFDLPYVVRLVMGRHWSGLDDARRKRFLDVFTRLISATYAARFDGFEGETFAVVSEHGLKSGRQLVRTELRKSDGETVQLDYVLRRGEETWRIVNVVANGVSDLSLKRSEYASIIKSDGIEELLAKLDRQVRSLRAGDAQ